MDEFTCGDILNAVQKICIGCGQVILLGKSYNYDAYIRNKKDEQYCPTCIMRGKADE